MECLRQGGSTPGTAWGDRRWEPIPWWSPGSCDPSPRMPWSHEPKLLPSLIFYFPDVADVAGRRTRPVRVARLDDSAGLDGVPRWGWLRRFTLVGGNFGRVRQRGRRKGCLHVDHGRKRREGFFVSKCVPTSHHPPIGHTTSTALQQQHHSSGAARVDQSKNAAYSSNTAVQRYTCGPVIRQELGVVCTFFYDSLPFGEDREPSPGEAFNAPRSRSWDSSGVASPRTPRACVWGGRCTSVRSPGAGWRAIERRVVSVPVSEYA